MNDEEFLRRARDFPDVMRTAIALANAMRRGDSQLDSIIPKASAYERACKAHRLPVTAEE